MYIHHIALSKTDIHLIKQEVVIGDNHTELSNLHVLVQITVHSTVRTYRKKHSYFVHLKKIMSFLFMLFLYNNYYSERCSKNIRDCSEIEITRMWQYNLLYRQSR